MAFSSMSSRYSVNGIQFNIFCTDSLNVIHYNTHYWLTGYDLNVVNLYISKLFENIGRLRFEDVHDSDKYTVQITGVESHLGELLNFTEVLQQY